MIKANVTVSTASDQTFTTEFETLPRIGETIAAANNIVSTKFLKVTDVLHDAVQPGVVPPYVTLFVDHN